MHIELTEAKIKLLQKAIKAYTEAPQQSEMIASIMITVMMGDKDSTKNVINEGRARADKETAIREKETIGLLNDLQYQLTSSTEFAPHQPL